MADPSSVSVCYQWEWRSDKFHLVFFSIQAQTRQAFGIKPTTLSPLNVDDLIGGSDLGSVPTTLSPLNVDDLIRGSNLGV
ncbi:hypothetical protein MJO28_005400 [Puccinia striiformis f. sp. tritici]|uniref:Uncharacterized protein n=1 Tax=Puccinia striiformis f. sp. tritici TaxID=168172 RepID=A0ACC0EKL3_9BASI|nr:hypothetical protein MJO28_005400 [Puccinia striiformis f. sp. tritici]KAI7960381.1 hypothetical protein MJO29_005449 [Puccinia striiformis f. sp. tritici]